MTRQRLLPVTALAAAIVAVLASSVLPCVCGAMTERRDGDASEGAARSHCASSAPAGPRLATAACACPCGDGGASYSDRLVAGKLFPLDAPPLEATAVVPSDAGSERGRLSDARRSAAPPPRRLVLRI